MTHKYEIVAEGITKTITESLSPNEALPSERELMSVYNVSRMTVRAAIAKLVEQGRVYNVHGAGTFVGSMDISKSPRLTSFTEDMVSRGLVPSSRILGAWLDQADNNVAERLGIAPGSDCTRLKRLRLADGHPMALEDVHIPREVLALTDLDLGRSLYEQLEEAGCEIYRATQDIRAVTLDSEDSRLLEVPDGSSALCVERLTCSRRHKPIEFARTLYRADRYSFRFVVMRDGSR
jgi:GntR family transcriptional regulator